MFNLTAIITFFTGVTTFFNDKFNAALMFTSQKLLAAPAAHFQESVTIITPVTITTTITSAAQAFTSSIASPGNELAVVHNPLPSGNISFFAALKEIICVLYALLRLSPDAATLISAFFFAVLLLALICCFASSSPAMKPKDLIHLEAQVNQKDELIQQLRASYAANTSDLLRRLQVQRDEADKRLSDTSAQHRSALATKDQQIRELRHELASADLCEEKARFDASDEVFKLNKEIGHLRRELDSLEDRLEAQDELVAGAEKAQEKVKVAEERALAAAQEALEANQKAEAAEKAQEEIKVAGERAVAAAISAEKENGQAAVDKVIAKLGKALDDKRVEEYRVQERDQKLKALKKEMEELKARVAEGTAARVPMPTIIQPVSSGGAPAVAGSPAAAPRPSAPAGQPGVIRRPPVKGPFPDIRWGSNSKRG